MKPEVVTVAEAMRQYTKARVAFVFARRQLRNAIREESHPLLANAPARRFSARHRCTRQEADDLAVKVRNARKEFPQLTQGSLGKMLGISRCLVSHYLRSPKYADLKA